MNKHIFNKLSKLIQLSANKGHNDKFVQQFFFKENKNLGSHDRREIKPIYYKIVKHFYFIEHLIKNTLKIEAPNAEDFIYFVCLNEHKMNELLKSYNISYEPALNIDFDHTIVPLTEIANELKQDLVQYQDEAIFQEIERLIKSETREDMSILFSMNELFIDKLIETVNRFKYDRNKFFSAFNQEADTTIRITSNAKIENIYKELDDAGIQYAQGEFNKQCIKLSNRTNLNLLEMSKSPLFEIQDEGSQLISFYMDPMEGDRILDFCAGAGGKTLHIADITRDMASSIVATDEDHSRTKEIFKRNSKFRYRTIWIEKIGVIAEKYGRFFDKILVDAPCSGSGTLRRDPHLKYKITQKEVAKRAKIQLDILDEVKNYLLRGGEITYSTCSVFPDENENVVKEFLKENDNFELVPPNKEFIEYFNLPANQVDMGINLYPMNGTDGFFMCKLRKISN